MTNQHPQKLNQAQNQVQNQAQKLNQVQNQAQKLNHLQSRFLTGRLALSTATARMPHSTIAATLHQQTSELSSTSTIHISQT